MKVFKYNFIFIFPFVYQIYFVAACTILNSVGVSLSSPKTLKKRYVKCFEENTLEQVFLSNFANFARIFYRRPVNGCYCIEAVCYDFQKCPAGIHLLKVNNRNKNRSRMLHHSVNESLELSKHRTWHSSNYIFFKCTREHLINIDLLKRSG